MRERSDVVGEVGQKAVEHQFQTLDRQAFQFAKAAVGRLEPFDGDDRAGIDRRAHLMDRKTEAVVTVVQREHGRIPPGSGRWAGMEIVGRPGEAGEGIAGYDDGRANGEQPGGRRRLRAGLRHGLAILHGPDVQGGIMPLQHGHQGRLFARPRQQDHTRNAVAHALIVAGNAGASHAIVLPPSSPYI